MIVIGGGLAGLSAGVALAEAGWRVRLFEQRPFLGGRATSYVLPDGEHVDNCQHVTLGVLHEPGRFLPARGGRGQDQVLRPVVVSGSAGTDGNYAGGMLPAPLHMTGSFLTFAPLTLADKMSIASALLDILRGKGHTADLDYAGRNFDAGVAAEAGSRHLARSSDSGAWCW